MPEAPGAVFDNTPPRGGGRIAAAAAGLCAAAVLALYWPVRDFEFIWEDTSYLLHSPELRDPSQWRIGLLQARTGESVFRPLALLTFGLELWSGHSGPRPYHLANLLLHALNTALVTLLVWRLLGRNSPPGFRGTTAVICGLLYGLRPALTEPVAWISLGRFDLLMTTFLLIALGLEIARPAGSWGRACAMGLLFLAALLTKETAVGFLLALPFVHLALAGPPGPSGLAAAARVWSSHLRVYAGLAVAFVAYLLLRLAALGPPLGMGQVMARYESIGPIEQHVLVVAASLAHYVSETFWIGLDPAPNRVLPLPVEGLHAALSVAIIAGVVALTAIAIHTTEAGRAPAGWFLAFLAALLPVSNIIPAPTHAGELQIASRYLALPLVFACLAAGSLASNLLTRRPGALKFLAGFAGVWLVACAAAVSATIPLWKDEGTVYRWAIARSGESSWRYLYINLGAYYLRTGDLAQAREAFLNAVKFPPRSAALAGIAWYNLGNVEAKLGHVAPAAEAFRASLALDPDNLYSRAGLAELERSQGRAGSAAALLEEGLDRLRAAGGSHPDRGLLHFRLGLAYADHLRREEAVSEFNTALQLIKDEPMRVAVEQALQAVAGVPSGAR